MKTLKKLAVALATVAVASIGVMGVAAPAHADTTWGYLVPVDLP